MKLMGFFMVLVGALATVSFDVPKHKAITSVKTEWKCSKCGWHSYEGTTTCYYCGAPR